MTPELVALLLKGAITGLPMLIQQYNIMKEKNNFTPEQRDELDALIESYRSKPEWQEN